MRTPAKSCSKGSIIATFLIVVAAAVVTLLFWRLAKFSVAEGFAAKAFKFVYVYSPNCKFCDAFNPDWDKFTREIRESTLKDITIATEKTVDASKYNAEAFPTVFVFVDGKQADKVEGRRSTTELWDLLRKNMATKK